METIKLGLKLCAIICLLAPGVAVQAQPDDTPTGGAPPGDNAPPAVAPSPPPPAAAESAPQPPSTPPAPTPPPPNLETLGADEARAVLGSQVGGAGGEDMGVVVDILFDQAKQPRAAVIDFGGFLGVGTRKIAIDWRLLQFLPPGAKTPIKLDLARADVQAAPEYKAGAKTVSVVGPPPAAEATPAPADQ
ncbi:MAG TPA: PRC-barrel domain-containing protein [Stellaceae bacterium]|jgi:hypothetical protein|nr:PRC-barrel domain-containing protein [Stellaceae bacterium]